MAGMRVAAVALWLTAVAGGCGGAVVVEADVGEEVAGDLGGEAVIYGTCTGDEDCDDGDPCTVDVCGPKGCSVGSVAVDAACDDLNPCTQEDRCQEDGKCTGSAVDCEDGNPCTADSCNLGTGACESQAAADGTPCSDGALCTVGDLCHVGLCVGQPLVCQDKALEDCQVPVCNPVTGGCDLNHPKEAGMPCKDGNPCTDGDGCDAAGVCQPGTTHKCSASHPCRKAWCNDKGKEGENPCVEEWKDEGVGCDDKDKCSEDDQCLPVDGGPAMACQGKAVVCDDNKPCTAKFCDPELGCQFDPLPKEGTMCAAVGGKCGLCVAGSCVADDEVCDDGNVCTKDSCLTGGPCTYEPLSVGLCNDADGCTVEDHCDNGLCVGTPKGCNDKNDCTDDYCDKGKCYHLSVPDFTPCDDAEICSIDDYCGSGLCLPGGYNMDCAGGCGDGVCAYPDTPTLCPVDCGPCGDGICGKHENGPNGGSCPMDCLAACGDGKCQGGEGPVNCLLDCGGCGDGFCGANETYKTCAGDCPPACGDKVCSPGENVQNCPVDCLPPCGDGTCNWGENYINCPADCSVCGDGFCSKIESLASCPQDCATACGNAICEGGESPATCAVDCGSCGDGLCGYVETYESCAADCQPGCGDGECVVDDGESEQVCPVDCAGDTDGDGWNNVMDNCPTVANPGQEDNDGDGTGDGCDPDDDNDLEGDATDCAPFDSKTSHLSLELCDGKDNNCDGESDNGKPVDCKVYYLDADGDGFGATAGLSQCLCAPWGQFTALVDGDCDPLSALSNPDAPEICDGQDNNCNGKVDEGHPDIDGDGLAGCVDPDDDNDGLDDGDDNCPEVDNAGQEDLDGDGLGDACEDDTDGDGDPDEKDCAPLDLAISHLAAELCNEIDDNCDGKPDVEALDCLTWYLDKDLDGFGVAGSSLCLCKPWEVYSTQVAGDCAPLDAAIYPGASEVCNGKDDDCSEVIDEEVDCGDEVDCTVDS